MTTSTSRYNGLVGSAAIKPPVKVATTANITLSGLQTIDGVALAENDRVLVKNQSDGISNGVYTASSGVWGRAADFNGAYDVVQGTMISVVLGAMNGGYIFSVDTVTPVIGTSSINFSQKIFSDIDVKTFAYYGVVGDGVADDTVALSNALNSGQEIYCRDEIIKFSKVTSNQPIKLVGKVTLQHDGSAITGTSALVFNNTIRADHLIVRGNSTDTIYDLMQTSASTYINTLELQSTAEQGGRGGYTNKSSDVVIEKLITENIARPFVSETASGYLSNIHIGDVIIDTYIRGIKFDKCTEFSVGNIFAKNRWTGVVATPGYNGVLLQDCNNFKIGNSYIANSAEHAFRIGGAGSGVYGGIIGDIISVDSGGCGLKINTDPTTFTRSVTIGNITGVNCGEGSALGNKEVVRLTRTRNVQLGQVLGSVSVTTALIMADIDNLTVAGLNVSDVNGRCIKFDETQDTSSGVIKDVYIGYVTGDCNNIRALIDFDYGGVGRTVENVVIDNVNAVGYTNFLVTMDGGCNINGVIKISATVPTTLVIPLTESPVNDSRYILDINYGGKKYIGRGDLALFTGVFNTEAGGTLDLGGTPSNFGGIVSQNIGASSGNGAYGGSFICGRAGSGRRAAGIASKQIGANTYQQGLAILVQNAGATGTDILTEACLFKPSGILNLPLLPTYANEAAALAGGLVAGDFYKTATGELRFKL